MKPRVILKNVSAKWNKKEPGTTLRQINLDVTSNQLIAIVGPVGSGKSSLLNLLLGELSVEKGKKFIQGKISYSSQEPWLFSGSIRQNICFNNNYNLERYKRVVEVCDLVSDFELLPHGDQTLISEKGKSLSGGQRARINLARCIYKEADIYLLDDPLSAVDTTVGKHLYEKCIKGFLKDKICILITHQLQYISNADKIIMMKNGGIEKEGSYQELQKNHLDFAQTFEEFKNEEEVEVSISEQITKTHNQDEGEDETQVIEKEQMDSGSINLGVYFAYLSSGGGKIMLLLLTATFLTAQVAATAGDYYISYWVNEEQKFSERVLTKVNETLDRDSYIYTYSGIISGTILISTFHTFYFMFYFTNVSVNLHRVSFMNLLQAPLRFFHNNPSSRILNRFSKDLGCIDEYIPMILYDVIQVALMLTGSFVLSFMINLWLLVPALVLVTIFYVLRIIYIKASRSVKRIEGIAKSPILGHMTASIQGLSTIRAFSAQEILIKEFDNFQDDHSSAWYLFIASNRCFGFWIDIICIIFFAVSISILLYFNTSIYGGDIGLVITQYTTFIGSLQWEVRQWSELENNMVSVERVLEYTKLEKESKLTGTIKKVSENWPQKGQIEFQKVCLKYNDKDTNILKDLTFTIKPQEKIGIVGRTGAGKTSILTALFQLYPIQGKIIIDNVDITKIPIEESRSKISIIPQEPVLFSGSIRENLDPFGEFSDEALWNVLEQVKLRTVVAELSNGLQSNVTEDGSNFSVGQRQLLCLARALIRNNKILVIDEATANVDPHTDGIIQNTIRDKFVECTVLTIAHRLHTVMDSDKIIVINDGKVEEFDHPYMLLRKKDGLLSGLVQNVGRATACNLENIAKENYEKRHKKA